MASNTLLLCLIITAVLITEVQLCPDNLQNHKITKRESDPDDLSRSGLAAPAVGSNNAKAGITDAINAAGAPAGLSLVNSPKQIMMGTFQAMLMPMPTGDQIAGMIPGGLNNLGGIAGKK